MKKIFAFFLTLFSINVASFVIPSIARAVCPVCTVAVVAGLEVSRMLGVDDIVTSIWIGGLILSASFWAIDWIEKSKFKEKIYKFTCEIKGRITKAQSLAFSVIILMYGLVFVPLLFTHTIGIARNTLWGIDKIVLGTVIGSVMFLIGMWIDKKVRKARGGKQLFQFQMVVFPTLSLIISSLVFYFVTKY
ncbi:MAG: hypothetical protein EHM20_12105 [Alphaproteobacteria bacterium]|nr:MAG: hypothetical protein EHM20_12105 [Alphaproteobacteria bacterium]